MDIIDELAPRLWAVIKEHASLAASVLRHYADHSLPDFPGVIFKDPEQPGPAEDFLKWLKELGLQGSDLRFVCFDATSQRSRPLAKWKKALDLNWRAKVNRIHPLNGRKDWACPWLGIEPVFPEGVDGKMAGSAAFRFIMVMGIITYKWAKPLKQPELVILCGLPASGKTTCYEQNYMQTHVHVSQDILKRDAKVMEKFRACLQRRESMVVDNTNLTAEHRQRYIPEAKLAGYQVVGIQFEPDLEVSLERNRERNEKVRVPEKAIQKMYRQIERLSGHEGFDEILVKK
jgi:predicted kinase